MFSQLTEDPVVVSFEYCHIFCICVSIRTGFALSLIHISSFHIFYLILAKMQHDL
jgi:hypothetical protein